MNRKKANSLYHEKRQADKGRRLKRDLVLQSFCPLFFLLFIKYFDTALFAGAWKFLMGAIQRDLTVWEKAADVLFYSEEPKIYSLLIILLCFSWSIWGIMVYIFFEKMQESSLNDFGEKIQIHSFEQDVGITFLVTYILPLMMDNVNSRKGFLIFLILMIMMVKLLLSSNLYYQNPVLILMGYRIFRFMFVDTADEDKKGKTFIGMAGRHGALESHEPFAIRQKLLSDSVYLILDKRKEQEIRR